MGININNLGEITRQDRRNESTIILSVARLVEKKGIDYGIKAVAGLTKKFRELQYFIIGDGIMRNELLQMIEKHQLQTNVKLFGWMTQDEIFSVMRKADIFLAPSVTSRTGSQEGIPVVLMEAMAHRLPVVATRHSGIPEIVINGQNGLLADERDINGIADKLEYLITNPKVSISMGEEGRKLIEKSYDIERLNKKLIQIFSEGCHQSQN
jgi:colanic acid/amylovoran biosynthesis glycosyltransferase